jgi:hypothetical protein
MRDRVVGLYRRGVERWSAVRARVPRPHPLVLDGLVALVAAGLAGVELLERP